MDLKERADIIGEILDYCKENDIISYYELKEYAYKNSIDKWVAILQDRGSRIVISEYLKSKKRSEKRKYDKPRYEAMDSSVMAVIDYKKKKEQEYIKELDAMENSAEDKDES